MKMIINPVYTYEKKVMVRSIKFSIAISLFNAFLAFIVFVSMSSVIQNVKTTAMVQYTSFLMIFRLVALIEFLVVLFIIPALTAGAISSEKERKTLDLLYTTRIKPFDIVAGKFLAAFFATFMLVVSSLPVMALVFVYGGITVGDILKLSISYLLVIYYAGSIGLFASSLSRSTNVAAAAAYAVLIVLMLATLPHGILSGGFSIEASEQTLLPIDAGAVGDAYAHENDASLLMGWIYSTNPITVFYINLNMVIGNKETIDSIFDLIGGSGSGFIRQNWFIIGMGFQFTAATVLTALSVCNITPYSRFKLLKRD